MVHVVHVPPWGDARLWPCLQLGRCRFVDILYLVLQVLFSICVWLVLQLRFYNCVDSTFPILILFLILTDGYHIGCAGLLTHSTITTQEEEEGKEE